MANKIYLNSTFGYREDTLKNWQTANPVLEKGEISFVRDGYDGKFVKIGDGHTAWNSLPFAPLPKGEKGDKGEKGVDGKDGVNGKDGADYVLTEADKAEIARMIGGWKTLIDTTLSAEQAGVSTLYIEIPNGEEELKKASQMQISVDIIPQNDFAQQIFECAVKNNGGGVYNSQFCWSSIAAGNAGVKHYFRALASLFKLEGTQRDFLCLYSAPSKTIGNNGAGSATKILSEFNFKYMPKNPPYLCLALRGDGLFAEGTRIRLEVI